jgi:V/A-type H+-transporting ATPase subunit K
MEQLATTVAPAVISADSFFNFAMLILGWFGLYAPLALAAIGSIIGCSVAGKAAFGALLETETGYGKYIGVTALPSSQAIYGVVVTLTLNGKVVNLTSVPGLLTIGTMVGVALMYCAIKQGQCVAQAIKVSKSKPEVFGLSVAPAGIIEGFAIFAFIFALIVSGNIPN